MTPEELIERIKGLNNLVVKLGKREPEAVAELDTLYRAAFGVGFVPGCKNCVIKAFHKLQALTLEKLTEMAEQKFKLKKGIVIQYPAFSPNHYTSDNMTDEVAAKYLAANPDGAQYFETIPDKQDDEDDDDKLTAKELIAKIKDAQTIEEVKELVPAEETRVTVQEAAQKRISELEAQ